MQIFPCILSCFNISSTILLASQCIRKLTNPMILSEYSLCPNSTSSTSTKSPLQAENSTFFSLDMDKKTLRVRAPKHVISSEKFNFFLRRGPPLPTPHLLPHQAFWVRPCVLSPQFQPGLCHCVHRDDIYPSASFTNVGSCSTQVSDLGLGLYFLPVSFSAVQRCLSVGVLQDIVAIWGL